MPWVFFFFCLGAILGALGWCLVDYFAGGSNSRESSIAVLVHQCAIAAAVVGTAAALSADLQAKKPRRARLLDLSASIVCMAFLVFALVYFRPDAILTRAANEVARPFQRASGEIWSMAVAEAGKGNSNGAQRNFDAVDILLIELLLAADGRMREFTWSTEEQRRSVLSRFVNEKTTPAAVMASGRQVVPVKTWDSTNAALSSLDSKTRERILDLQDRYGMKTYLCQEVKPAQ